jgi:hypothetical protein
METETGVADPVSLSVSDEPWDTPSVQMFKRYSIQ